MFSVTEFPAVIVAPVMTTACGCAWFAATTPLISAGGAVGVVGVELLLPQATSVMVMTQPARIANAASSVNSRLESAVPDSISFRSCDIVPRPPCLESSCLLVAVRHPPLPRVLYRRGGRKLYLNW